MGAQGAIERLGPARDDGALASQVRVACQRLLVRQARRGLPGIAVAAAFVAITVGHEAGALRFGTWLVVMGATLASHVVAVVHDESSPERELSWCGWPLAVLQGIAWGLTPILLWPPQQSDQLLLLGVALAVIAGVCAVTAPLRIEAALVVVPVCIATAARFVIDGGSDSTAMAVGLVLFALALLWVQAESSRTIIELVRLRIENEALTEQLRRLADTDPLTGVGNRRRFLDALQREIDDVRARGHPAALALLDLDHFKVVNDLHGHPAGDAVLRAFTELVDSELGPTDQLARLGGEEFGVLLPGCSGVAARARLERIRSRVGTELRVGPGTITVSVGIVGLRLDDDAVSVVQRADAALYRAKHDGRDRVVLVDAREPPAAAG